MITTIVVTYLMQFTSDSSSADGNNNEVASSIGPISSLSQPSSTAQHKVGNSLLWIDTVFHTSRGVENSMTWRWWELQHYSAFLAGQIEWTCAIHGEAAPIDSSPFLLQPTKAIFFFFFSFFFFPFCLFFFSNPQGFDNIMVLWVRDRAVCLFVTKSFVKQIFQLILQIKPGSVGIFVMAPGTFALGASSQSRWKPCCPMLTMITQTSPIRNYYKVRLSHLRR